MAPGAEADALWTDAPGEAVGVQTADCVPILLVQRERRAVAAVHAGWRGTAARVAELSVAGLCHALGCSAAELVAAVGPHIGPCCYEVDEPVRRAIDQPAAFAPAVRPGHYMLDLMRCTREQLERAGLAPGAIRRVGGCTACDPARYPSFRRDRSGARMLHYVRMPMG
jgi:YfiH family protein